MSDKQINVELRNAEDKLRRRYSLLSKLFLLIAILFIIFVVFVFTGITSFEYGHDWALFNLEAWVIALSALLGVFIVLELFFYFHFSSVRNKRIELEKPKPEFINGKRVYVYTFPKGEDGGIFTKTYIEFDENSVLRLRSLMIPPEEL